jgi:hypothetical protein
MCRGSRLGDLGTTDFASVGQLEQTVMAGAKIAAEAFLDDFDLACCCL